MVMSSNRFSSGQTQHCERSDRISGLGSSTREGGTNQASGATTPSAHPHAVDDVVYPNGRRVTPFAAIRRKGSSRDIDLIKADRPTVHFIQHRLITVEPIQTLEKQLQALIRLFFEQRPLQLV